MGQRLIDCVSATHVVVISDENVDKFYGDQVKQSLTAIDGVRFDKFVVAAGESSKSVQVAESLWKRMCQCRADRKSVVVAVGGGVVGDLAGFIAATYGRGVSFFQIPTTLLAQVDSSVGGKVGINLPEAKNIVGSFCQPLGVLIDVDVLKTLEDREFRAGLAEVVKYGVILDSAFFEHLESNVEKINRRNADVLIEIVKRCCQLKAKIVEQDERDTMGLRAVLNYGHTFGHALESITGYTELLHGEGVSIGMVCAAKLAVLLNRVDQTFADRQFKLLQNLQLPVDVPKVDLEKVIELMARDKKVEHGKMRFVLPAKLGHVELVPDVPHNLILRSLS